MKSKDSKETLHAFLSMITKKNRPRNFWVDKGTEFAGEFKKLCKAEGIQIYSTMSETKAFAEHTIRSLKNILDRYMEDNGYKYIHKLTQFVTTEFSKKLLDRLDTKECKEFQLFVHSVQQTTTRI